MEAKWHYIRDGESIGPIPVSELRDLIGRGVLSANDLVWCDGMAEWATVASQNFVPPTVTPPPVPSTASPKQPQRRSSRRQQGVPPHLVIWSVVGIVAVLLCVGWWIMSKPQSTNRRVARPTANQSQRSTTTVRRAEERTTPSETSIASPAAIEHPTVELPQAVVGDSTPPPTSELSPTESEPAVPAATKEPPQAPVTPPAEAAPVPTAPNPADPSSRTIYQRVKIKRQPAFSMAGLESKQSLHYEVASQLNVEEDASKRRTKVVQIVLDTRLLAADEMSRANFEKALAELKRQQYTYLLNEFGEVIEFTGHKENRAALPVDLSSMSGFQMTSVIDEDGWRELAELTFLRPPPDREQADAWQRQMKHDWDALGSWSGVTTFTPQAADDGIQTIDFSRNLTYHPPAAGVGGLPFKITAAEFKIQKAQGAIEFDLAKNRVKTASESFRVRGKLTAELAGLGGTDIGQSEDQEIEISISDQRPLLQ